MVASKISDVINADVANTSSSLALGCASSVPCSICFDLVIDDGERSIAKLHCGHKFHLDCIGSAFNTKGTMQCPNCRKVESGRWLFADGSADAISETEVQDWMPNEGPHDLSYSRRPFGFHWCPFRGFMFHSPLEEAESSLHTSSPASALSYIFQPSEHAGNSNFHHPLNGPHTTNIQHPSWGWNCHFLPYREYMNQGNPAPLNHAVARSPSFLHPLHYTQISGERSDQSHERIQIFQWSYHRQEQARDITNSNGYRRYGGYYDETESSYNHAHERESESLSPLPLIPGSYIRRVSRGFDFSNRNHWF